MRQGRELRATARPVSARLAMLDRPQRDGPRRSGSRRVSTGLAAAAGAVAAVRVAGALDARRNVCWRPGGGDRHDGALGARVLGPAGPAVVLLHGQAGSGRYWGSAWDGLAAAHRVVVPDLLGFGASPRPDAGYDADRHADAVLECLDELGIVDPAVLVAHSMGCIVALRLATRDPDRVAAMVGFGPPIYRDAESAWRHLAKQGILTRLFAMDTPPAKAVYSAVCRRAPGLAGALATLLRLDLPGPIARDGIRYSWDSYSRSLRHLILDAPAISWLSQLRLPVRLIAARDDAVVDAAVLQDIARRCPSVSVDLWPAGGHHLPLTHPSDCLSVLSSILDELKPSGGAP
jgi:pimeloyl-ACP methyl ester carboxylesterase